MMVITPFVLTFFILLAILTVVDFLAHGKFIRWFIENRMWRAKHVDVPASAIYPSSPSTSLLKLENSDYVLKIDNNAKQLEFKCTVLVMHSSRPSFFLNENRIQLSRSFLQHEIPSSLGVMGVFTISWWMQRKINNTYLPILLDMDRMSDL